MASHRHSTRVMEGFGKISVRLLAASLWLLCGCATVDFVELREKPPNPILERLGETARGGPAPSPRSQAFLNRSGYQGQSDFSHMLNHCRDRIHGPDYREARYAAAEISYLAGKTSIRSDRALATELHLDAAQLSWSYLSTPDAAGNLPDPGDGIHREVAEIYNTSLREFLRLVRDSGRYRLGNEIQLPISGRRLAIEIPHPSHTLTKDQLGEFEFVADYELNNLRTRYARDGVGVPIMIKRRKTDHPLESYYAAGLSFPVTVVARFDQTLSGQTVLQLYDSRETDGVTVHNTLLPLETDLSTPLAWFLTDPKKSWIDTFAFLRPDKAQDLEGLYMVQPYDPDRIPVLMVHGIWSSPITWMEMFNELQSDPTIRDKYQFWFYLYPTGQPLTFAAAGMRDRLKEVRKRCDPYGQNEKLDQMVVVGHSMGGLMSYLMTIDSDDILWNSMSRLPVERIQADANTKHEIRRVFFFEGDGSVDRIVTIGSPFRGSGYANRFTQWLSGSIVSLPNSTSALSELIFRQNNQSFWDRMFAPRTAVDSLNKDSAILKLVNSQSVPADVKHHNVVGVDKGDSIKTWTDGVVKLRSASAPQATSEIRVKASHGKIHRHPETIAEVRRVLLDHLASLKVVRPL